MESSTYVSELVSACLSMEMITETRYNLRMLVFTVDEPSLILGGNMYVIFNCTLTSIILKKKHNVISYHHVTEDIADGVIRLSHVRSDNNYADLLTK